MFIPHRIHANNHKCFTQSHHHIGMVNLLPIAVHRMEGNRLKTRYLTKAVQQVGGSAGAEAGIG